MRQVITTKDGSHTISIPDRNVTYHSLHGAIQESMHVFIKNGLYLSDWLTHPGDFRILEMGFGTGLNALLTLMEAQSRARPVHYSTIELLPLNREEMGVLNYCEQLGRKDLIEVFRMMHTCDFGKEVQIATNFSLEKFQTSLQEFQSSLAFDLIYYDAFAPNAQPELWTKEIFEKLFAMTAGGGSLVTYCSKGDVRRAMIAAGYVVEKLNGPLGKREMLRARCVG